MIRTILVELAGGTRAYMVSKLPVLMMSHAHNEGRYFTNLTAQRNAARPRPAICQTQRAPDSRRMRPLLQMNDAEPYVCFGSSTPDTLPGSSHPRV